jgi:hypothetical protein
MLYKAEGGIRMKTERLAEILDDLERQRQNKIFAIIKDFREHGGTVGNCPINWWGKNPEYPELYRLECQIDRYKKMVLNQKHLAVM